MLNDVGRGDFIKGYWCSKIFVFLFLVKSQAIRQIKKKVLVEENCKAFKENKLM